MSSGYEFVIALGISKKVVALNAPIQDAKLKDVIKKLNKRKPKKAAEQKEINDEKVETLKKIISNKQVQVFLKDLSSRYSGHSRTAMTTTMNMRIPDHSLIAITVPKSLDLINLIAERFGNCLRTNPKKYTQYSSCSNSVTIIPYLENVNISLVIDEVDNKSLSAAYWGFVGNDIIIFWIDALSRPEMRREEDNKEKVQQLMLMQAKYLSKLTNGNVYIQSNLDYDQHNYNTVNVNEARLSATMIYKIVEIAFMSYLEMVESADIKAQITKEKELIIQETFSSVKEKYEKVDLLSPDIVTDKNEKIGFGGILELTTNSVIQQAQEASREHVYILPEAFEGYVKKTLNWESIVEEHINFSQNFFSLSSIYPLVPDHLDTRLNFGLDLTKNYENMDNNALIQRFGCSLFEVDTGRIPTEYIKNTR